MPQPLLAPTKIAAKSPPRTAKPRTLTPREEKLIHALVWDGKKRREAALAAGLSDNGAYKALRQPHVKAALLAEYEVLRTSARPRAIHRIDELMEGAESERVQLDAAKYLDGGDKAGGVNVQVNLGMNIAPGYLVNVSGHADEAQKILDAARSTRSVMDSDMDTGTDGS